MIYGWKKVGFLGAALIIVVMLLLWWHFQPKSLEKDFVSSNGRIEAVDIDIATKIPGRIKDIKVDEGDFVSAGEIVADMDTETLEAQIREAKAQEEQAKSSIDTAQSQVKQRQSEKDSTVALVSQREAELKLVKNRFARTQALFKKAAVSEDAFDEASASFYKAQAALSAAQAQVAAADAAITNAKSLVVSAQSSVVARASTIERLQAELKDSALKAPRDGRIQYRVAQPGEVLSAGGKVLSMVDLSDVYMNFFLPTEEAGRVRIGAEVHLVLDAAQQYVIPAKVTFVADVAQFTPKTVETASERQKLMFRVKAKISPELLKKYIRDVKTGLPGMAYIQLNPNTPWPKNLQVRLPHE